MTAHISFRANALGTLSPSRAQREEVLQELTANLRAKTTGILRAQGLVSKQSTNQASTPARDVNNELGRDTFLQLLVTQMRYQDPLDPVENTEMIAQLAQFTALEQMTQVNEGMTGLRENIDVLNGNVDQLNFITAQGLLGRHVEGINEAGEVVRGRVDSVHLNGSLVILSVEGVLLPMSRVAGIGTEGATAPGAPDDAEGTETKQGFLRRLLP